MSSYFGEAFNPKTRQIEPAEYLDDYYGPHTYAVRFEDGLTYPEAEVSAAQALWISGKDGYYGPHR